MPGWQALEVPVLDLEVAAGFLAARTGDADHQAAAGLAEAVGGLPLALEQAAAYIEATGDSLAAYLASFHKRRADLLSRGQPSGYTGTVAATWALAFTQVEHSEPGAAALLRLLAFCAPEAIPLRLLLQIPSWVGREVQPAGGAACVKNRRSARPPGRLHRSLDRARIGDLCVLGGLASAWSCPR
jgi:hypothetical protein